MPGTATFGYLDRAINCSRGDCIRPNTEPVPNAFMAAPPRHPFFAHVIRQLPKARSRLFHGRNASHPNAATGPTFLSTSLMHWARHEKGAGVNIRPNPVIYNHPWAKRRHTCGHGTHNAYEQPPKVTLRRVVAAIRQSDTHRSCVPPAQCARANATTIVGRHVLAEAARPLFCSALRSPCKTSTLTLASQERLALFNMCAGRLPTAVTTTFWTHSWVDAKQNKNSPPIKASGNHSPAATSRHVEPRQHVRS